MFSGRREGPLVGGLGGREPLIHRSFPSQGVSQGDAPLPKHQLVEREGGGWGFTLAGSCCRSCCRSCVIRGSGGWT